MPKKKLKQNIKEHQQKLRAKILRRRLFGVLYILFKIKQKTVGQKFFVTQNKKNLVMVKFSKNFYLKKIFDFFIFKAYFSKFLC